MTQTIKTDIVIVGAGPVGLSLFLAFTQHNYRVLLLESKSPDAIGMFPKTSVLETLGVDSRNYALTPENVAWLESLGVAAEDIRQEGTPMEAMHVVYEAGSASFELSAHQVRQPYLAWMLRHDRLCHALWKRVCNAPLGAKS